MPCYNRNAVNPFEIICFAFEREGYLPWVASVSPFPMEFLPSKGKFQGISVFNHLLPLDYDGQTCLSDSSGLRRLNRGSCHTPKFARTDLYLLIHQGSKLRAMGNKWGAINKCFRGFHQ